MFWFILMGFVWLCLLIIWANKKIDVSELFIGGVLSSIVLFLVGVFASVIVMIGAPLTATNTYNIAKTDDNIAKIEFRNNSVALVYKKDDKTYVSKTFYNHLPTIYATDKESYVEIYTYTCNSIFMYGGSSTSNNHILYINKNELDFPKKPLIHVERE